MAPPNLGSSEEIRTRYLISLVKDRPAIYNKALPEYTNPEVKRKLWTEIAEKIHKNRWDKWKKAERRESVLLLQKRWSNLRTTFARELKNYIKAKREGYDPDSRKKYVHFDRMKFVMNYLILGIDGELKPAIEYFQNLNLDNEAKQEDSEEEQQDEYEEQYLEDSSLLEEEYNKKASDDEIEYLEHFETELVTPVKIGKNERMTEMKMDPLEKNLVKNNNNKKENIVKHHVDQDEGGIDQDVNFALSLVPMLRDLPRSQKLQAQIEILKIFQNYSD